VSARLWLVLVVNGVLMIGVAHRYVTLRDAWRSHNMALQAWEVLETDQLKRGQEIFGPGFILNPGPPPPGASRPTPPGQPTNSHGP